MIRATSHTLLILTTTLLLASPAVLLAASRNAPPATESGARLHAELLAQLPVSSTVRHSRLPVQSVRLGVDLYTHREPTE